MISKLILLKRKVIKMSEEEFLKEYAKKNYPKPYLTADLLAFKDNKILLVKRKNHPCMGRWALPGGFSKADETIEEAAKRELKEETGASVNSVKLIGVYSKPGRDPRGWVVSVAYMADLENVKVKAADDAESACFFSYEFKEGKLILSNGDTRIEEDDLSFDHALIIKDALKVR